MLGELTMLPAEFRPEQLIAVIDTREQGPLNLSPLRTVRRTLLTGDYSVRGLESVVAVERKSLADLVACTGLQRIVQDLGDSFPGVESTPGVCGGEPCIVRTRIPVWILEQMRRQGVSEADILRSYPTLRATDLATAWAYVRVHRSEIERQMRENEEA
jgi:uncharacterized protein (DUF433 family)